MWLKQREKEWWMNGGTHFQDSNLGCLPLESTFPPGIGSRPHHHPAPRAFLCLSSSLQTKTSRNLWSLPRLLQVFSLLLSENEFNQRKVRSCRHKGKQSKGTTIIIMYSLSVLKDVSVFSQSYIDDILSHLL